MMMQIKKNLVFILAMVLVAVGSGNALMAQTPVTNQAAVDTLTKDVAIAVLTSQPGTKAAQIVNQLSACADSCDAVAIINRVGSWDLVANKMAELGQLKNRADFQTMSPGDANAAIHNALDKFYGKYKADKNYGIPLSENARMQMLARIDRLLPPNAAVASAEAGLPADEQLKQGNALTGNVDSSAVQTNLLGDETKRKQETSTGMILLSALLGLLAGAGIVYFGLFRAQKKEVDRLTSENLKISRDLDTARRTKATNEPRQSQPQNWKQPAANAPQPPELDKVNSPIMQQQPASPATPPVINAPLPDNTPSAQNQSGTASLVPVQTTSQPSVPVSAPARNEVFYFPPPDPTGQFDNGQRAEALSPESAYRFSTNAGTPDLATFRFEAEPGRLARLLTYRNYMVEPACDSENSYTSQFTRIVNRKDGQAALENGTWRVKTKALIRYE